MKIERVILEGFKSFRDRTEVPLGDLTLLAGANSSGKSTIMQPLLLMKQTLESSFDPGSLLINGKNILFSDTKQMFWLGGGENKNQIAIGLKLRATDEPRKVGYEIRLEEQRRKSPHLQLVQATLYDGEQAYSMHPELTAEERTFFEKQARQILSASQIESQETDLIFEFEVKRKRFFLIVTTKVLRKGHNHGVVGLIYHASLSQELILEPIERTLLSMIHVPGLRGNPSRTYPVSAVEHNFPGIFPDYVASVIDNWQKTNPEKVNQLGKDLKELGLTWRVKASKKSATEVEIQVGRLPERSQDRGQEMVNIADVGFGLSQCLPVVVALLVAEPGQVVYLEQPEIHLHPRAEYQLSRLILRAVLRGVQVVVETHSELLLLGLQELIAKGQFGTHLVMLHWVQRDRDGVSYLNSTTLDEQGSWGDVPVDFAHVSLKAMENYLNAKGG